MFWRVSAAWQWPTSYSLSNCETDSGFQTGGVNPYAIFTILHTQPFLSLLNPKRRSTWTSLRIGCGCKGSGAWLAGTVNKRLLFPRNLYLSGKLVGLLRSWWELHCRFVSSYCICFCSKSLYVIFPVSVSMSLVHVHSIVITGELPRPVETLHFLGFKFLSPGWSYALIPPLDWLRQVMTCIDLSWLGFHHLF